ncbi:hypothetical protein BegalDRAFT_3233 [Beggiatoa alba B18LD]|uniref:Uncharacterized protein n=1 Tax=Beggiatoa alba B18LD TaxID=395493 RepID=I3CKB1_9GAMM|nr:hypothetical protein [Beggiatoa alba]EIJ44054.1 hypothetical protein BegalDRAFT_3233 [Beggiatoa alba B18LD]
MILKRAMTLSLLTALFNTPNSYAADALALEKFKAALNTCERSLQMPAPKSKGSLSILQSLVSRYERDRDFALKIDATLKDSTTDRYTGKYFVDQTLAQAYNTCEEQLSTKVSDAEALIAKQAEEVKQKAQQQEAVLNELMKKLNTAKQEVGKAVDEACSQYSNDPSNQSLVSIYTTAKQNALTNYPNIIKYTHESTFTDPDTKEAAKTTRTVQAWFAYCDELFQLPATAIPSAPPVKVEPAKPAEKPVEKPAEPPAIPPAPPAPHDEGPLPPPPQPNSAIPPAPTPAPHPAPAESVRPDIPAESPADTPPEETGEVSDDEEYNALVKALTGDKQKVLKTEKRLPDFFDNEDGDIGVATIWQFEAEDGSQCVTYKFNGDKMLDSKKNKGECPSF